MKVKACYWVPGLALLTAAPAWANYSWGQMGQFRPGIQLGIVVLVLVTEVLVIKPLLRMNWPISALAVVLANAASALVGSILLGGQPGFADLRLLLVFAIPSTVIEFAIVGQFAAGHSSLDDYRHRGHWTFIAVLAANLLSALVSFGYIHANYRGHAQPLPRVERGRMRSAAHQIAEAYGSGREAGTLELVPRLVHLTKPSGPIDVAPIDVAPPWLPWAVMRPALRYESALPRRLDPPGNGRPMVWTGAPYLNGLRGVIFTDGRYEEMSEGDFRKLGAVPAPPKLAIPPPEPSR